MATLNELETIYSFEDALNMLEIITIKSYNEWVVAEEAKQKRG